MKLVTTLVLIAFASLATTEIYVETGNLKWLGSGTELWADWFPAQSVERVNFGAWMHLDASYTAGMSNIVANGTNFVYQWTDWRTNTVYARRHGYWVCMPHTSASTQNNKTVVRFPFSEGALDTRPTLAFPAVRTDIYAVFSVLKSYANGSYITYIGGGVTPDFKGAASGGFIYSAEFSSAKILNGTNAIDGMSMSASVVCPTGGFHVVSMRTAGGSVLGDNLCRDRGYRCGGIDFAELLIFTNSVSDSVAAQINAYLKAKWATP